jgi:hypothetical protein
MRQRHRIPTLFTLSMLDVFCCALGCVILLWLLNSREARQNARAAVQKAREADEKAKEAGETYERLNVTRAELDAVKGRLNNVAAERDASLDQLAKKMKDIEKLMADSAAARKRIAELDALARDREKQAAIATTRAKKLDQQLHDADGLIQQLKALADKLPNLQADRDALAARILELEKDLLARKTAMLDVQAKVADIDATRKALNEQLTKIKIAADNRFAGIQLVGRRVVFLVDMSGSMKMVDEHNKSPEKWPAVTATIVRILRSLPDLEQFQVILFSDDVAYPLGLQGAWLQYDPAVSPDRVAQALGAIEPKGNTDMHKGFEAAFRFRPQGLDTIYLLSDGLPNIGLGLTEAESRTLSETEKTNRLCRFVRQMLQQKWNKEELGRPPVRIHSIGFFYESPEVGAFLWALSREHNGSFVGMSKP